MDRPVALMYIIKYDGEKEPLYWTASVCMKWSASRSDARGYAKRTSANQGAQSILRHNKTLKTELIKVEPIEVDDA